MTMRKRVVAGLIAMTAVVGAGMSAGTAAAGASEAGAGSAAVTAAGTWHYYGEYHTADGCLETGDNGLRLHRWQAFRCPKKSTGTYLLYVWY